MVSQDAAKRGECQNDWRDGTCPKCGETHYIIVRRGAIDAAVAEAVKERDAELAEWKRSNEMWFNDAKKANAEAAEARREERARLLDLLPTTWLDPLLSGPDKVLPGYGPWGGPDIERLMKALHDRLGGPPASAPEGG